MRAVRGRRQSVAGAAAVLALVGVLSGCGASARHVQDICTDVTTGTAALDRYDPAQPDSALALALGRFELVDKAVGKARETALPGGAAATLRSAWLDPAVRSMAPWQARLQAVRDAVASGDHARVGEALGPALALGTAGVDPAALRTAGYDACAVAFTAPTVASLTR